MVIKIPASSFSETNLQTQTRADIQSYDMPHPRGLRLALLFSELPVVKKKPQEAKAFNRENDFTKFVL